MKTALVSLFLPHRFTDDMNDWKEDNWMEDNDKECDTLLVMSMWSEETFKTTESKFKDKRND